MNTTKIGAWGEKQSCEFLKNLGYEILTVNYHSRYGEIDIIAKENNCLVFAEIKTRKNNFYGNAAEYVTHSKQKKIIQTAEKYIENNPDTELRFDVIEVYYRQIYGTPVLKKINHIKNAFICDF